jgi:DNA-directed RNA polymerase specialized sigma24 family protein
MSNPETHSRDSPRAPGAESSDSSLLRWIQNGNQDAATQLYFRYAERLRALVEVETFPALARREETEDIVQSIFSSFFRGVGKGYYDIPAGDEIWKLFLVIALNKICAKGTYHRAAKRDVRLTTSSEFLDQQSKTGQGADNPAFIFLQLVVRESLEKLPPLPRQMVTLRIEGFEIAEIAARTQRSKRTVERVLQEFRQELADILRRDD